MHKKVIIAITAFVLLSGAGVLNAQEILEKPKAQKQQQKQVRQKSKQKASKKAGKRKTQQAKQKAVKAKKGVQGAQVRAQVGPKTGTQRPRGNRPAVQKKTQTQMFQSWFGGMKKAYREKDMEKMGQLLRTMEQRQQQIQKGWQANKSYNRQPRQRGMHPGRGANRRRGWAKSNYRGRQRLGSYPRSRMYGGDFRDVNRNQRRRPRTRRGGRRSGRHGYYRS